MPIETISSDHHASALPVYIGFGKPGWNDYKVGAEYDVRMDDKGDMGFSHKARLIAKEEMLLEEVDEYALAFVGGCDTLKQAVKEAIPGTNHSPKDEVILYVMLREDKIEEFIKEKSIDFGELTVSDLTVLDTEDLE